MIRQSCTRSDGALRQRLPELADRRHHGLPRGIPDGIDHYWAAISHVPKAQQCGWCKDLFGVRWQILPAHMGELTGRPEQIQAMMRQQRIVIAELENA